MTRRPDFVAVVPLPRQPVCKTVLRPALSQKYGRRVTSHSQLDRSKPAFPEQSLVGFSQISATLGRCAEKRAAHSLTVQLSLY